MMFTLMLPWLQIQAEVGCMQKGHYCSIRVCSGASSSHFQFFEEFSLCLLQILRSCFCSHFVLSVHLTFRRLTAPSSAPHFHNKVDSQQWQRKLGSFPAEIFVGQRAHFGNGCVQIFHVCLQIGWGWRGCPRPPPVPTGRPTPMFDFFLTTPRNRLWSRAAAPTLPAFSPAFARGGGGRGETAATHTHTHMGHSLLHLALFGTGLLYLPRNRLFLAQKIILPLEEK